MAQSARQIEPVITVTRCNTVSEIDAQSVICAKLIKPPETMQIAGAGRQKRRAAMSVTARLP
jgi:hypothetical protein